MGAGHSQSDPEEGGARAAGIAPPPRPPATTPRIVVENIPADLKELPQWVAWNCELRGKKDGIARRTKVPIDVRSGGKASSTDPATWTSFEEALAAARTRGYDGIGFVFTPEDPYCGIDLDDCLDDHGEPVPEAREILKELDSYAEVSPSGTGVKAFVRASVPCGRGRRTRAEGFGEIEVYDRGRFFTVTGWLLPGSPVAIGEGQAAVDRVHGRYFGTESTHGDLRRAGRPRGGFRGTDDELIEKARSARNGKKFGRLFDGDISGYASQSEADLALCSMVAFYAGSDPERIDRVFRRSGLCREKWTERQDYRKATVAKAIAGSRPVAAREPGRRPGVHESAPDPLRHGGPQGLALEYRVATFTGIRWSVHARLLVDGNDVGPIDATATSTGRGKALEQVITRLADAGREIDDAARDEIRRWLDKALDPEGLRVVSAALRRHAASGSGEREEPTRVAAVFLRERLGLVFRDPDGSIFSETLGVPLKVYDLQLHGGADLLAALRKRAFGFGNPDADHVTSLGRTEKVARAAIPILVRDLPDEAGATVGPDSAAAKRFRSQLLDAVEGVNASLRIGSKTAVGKVEYVTSSLAGLVRDFRARQREAVVRLKETGEVSKGPGWGSWHRLHGGFDLWVLLRVERDRVETLLAVRAALLRQARVNTPPREPGAFVRLARAYGLAASDDVRVEGRLRAVLLASSLVDEVLGSGGVG